MVDRDLMLFPATLISRMMQPKPNQSKSGEDQHLSTHPLWPKNADTDTDKLLSLNFISTLTKPLTTKSHNGYLPYSAKNNLPRASGHLHGRCLPRLSEPRHLPAPSQRSHLELKALQKS
jgi:hypothetical protein